MCSRVKKPLKLPRKALVPRFAARLIPSPPVATGPIQAMAPGGKLFIATRAGKGGDSVEITVKDTGRGIQPEFLPHIFDPFFSTKGEGGTGLGLSVSYGIIRNHKGDIRVESKPGVGTTFTVELPACKEAGDGE